jgi:hypothetical protein
MNLTLFVLVPNINPSPPVLIVIPGKPGIVTVTTIPPGAVISVTMSPPSPTLCVGSPKNLWETVDERGKQCSHRQQKMGSHREQRVTNQSELDDRILFDLVENLADAGGISVPEKTLTS